MRRIFALLAFCLMLSACGQASSTPTVSGEEICFTDDLGREVTVENPQRVVCMTASFADIWCLAGGADTIVATTSSTWKYFDLPLKEDVVDLGDAKNLNLEQLIACEPDLILASCGTDSSPELEPVLTEMGLNVAYFSVNNFEDFQRMLKTCTEITGHPENYETYGVEVGKQVDAAIARADGSRPTVLYVRATGTTCKVKNSKGSVLGEMLAALDCVNIADQDESLLENLSMEAILAADPDSIFTVVQGSDPTSAQALLDTTLLKNPAWNTLTAVKEGRFYNMDQNLYNMKPNGRWGEAYEKLADILYPEK